MTTQEAYATLEKFIESERYWRQRVFASNQERLTAKLLECDRAIEALNTLAPQAENAAQARLFD